MSEREVWVVELRRESDQPWLPLFLDFDKESAQMNADRGNFAAGGGTHRLVRYVPEVKP